MEQRANLEAQVLINARQIKFVVILASTVVWVIGVFRVLWLGLMGTETVLRNMGKLDLDSDLTLPSWYSSLMLALSALLLFLVARSVAAGSRRDALKWGFLALIFVALSMDEAIAIHEMSLQPIRNAVELPAIFTFGWIPFAMVFVLALAVIYIPFLLRLPRPLAIGMLLSAVIYVFGVIGMGMVNGFLFSAYGEEKNFVFSLMSSVEEGFEILGLTLLILTLIDHLTRSQPPLAFRLAE